LLDFESLTPSRNRKVHREMRFLRYASPLRVLYYAAATVS
jgi:hypothetical protein